MHRRDFARHLLIPALVVPRAAIAQGLGLGLGLDDRRRMPDGVPRWVLTGGGIAASVDLDFVDSLYYNSLSGNGSLPGSFVTVSRASTAYEDDANGNWTSFGSNVLRVTNKGALIEEARTNSIRNNSMQDAVVGTPGTKPTNWFVINAIGLTSNVIATGTESGVDYIDIEVVGTGNSGATWRLGFDATNFIGAANGQAWTSSFFVKQVSGSLTNISGFKVGFATYTAGNSEISRYDSTTQAFPASSAVLGLSRFSNAATIADATAAFVDGVFTLSVTPSAAVDITFRIGWPQLELGAFATSPIRTTNAAVTRAADVVTLTTVPTFGNNQTLLGKGTPNAPSSYGTNQTLFGINDGTINNRLAIYRASGNGVPSFLAAAGGSSAGSAGVGGAWNGDGNLALGFASADHAVVFNSTVNTETTSGTPSGINRVDIGSRFGGLQFNGYVERIALWPTARLPNATLQVLTQ